MIKYVFIKPNIKKWFTNISNLDVILLLIFIIINIVNFILKDNFQSLITFKTKSLLF